MDDRAPPSGEVVTMQDPVRAQAARRGSADDALQEGVASRVGGVVRSVGRRAYLYDDPGTFLAAIEEVLRGLAAAGLVPAVMPVTPAGDPGPRRSRGRAS
ncbi:MAG TPA: hypothetical protein VGB19_12160 [Actinomycetota bacterium]